MIPTISKFLRKIKIKISEKKQEILFEKALKRIEKLKEASEEKEVILKTDSTSAWVDNIHPSFFRENAKFFHAIRKEREVKAKNENNK